MTDEKAIGKEREYKTNQKSVLKVLVVTKRYIDQYGNPQVMATWKTATDEVNLGSLAHPNPDILEWRYDIK